MDNRGLDPGCRCATVLVQDGLEAIVANSLSLNEAGEPAAAAVRGPVDVVPAAEAANLDVPVLHSTPTATLPQGIFVALRGTFTVEGRTHRSSTLLSVSQVQLTLTRKPSPQKSTRTRDPTPGPKLEASRQFERQFLNKSLVHDQDILCLSVINHFHPVLMPYLVPKKFCIVLVISNLRTYALSIKYS